MRWKVNIFLACAFLVSTHGQVVLIDETLDEQDNTPNASDTGNTSEQPTQVTESGSLENNNSGNEIPENDEIKPPDEDSGAGSSLEVLVQSDEAVNGAEHDAPRVTEDSIVSTTHGPVQGHLWGESTDIISFYDIPYGSFSTFFEAPQLPGTWEQTHHAATHSKRCPQLLRDPETQAVVISEDTDCLTLSVFVPREIQNASVLFHIHDGSFISGSGDPAIYGPKFLLEKGIILVLPNYRLGPLGFLCLHNETAPGNAALKDLTLALNWTKANIFSFGGDPDNIVVSGDGTSGALAGYLALSPASKDYVSKVIADSGSVISHWAIDRDPITTATVLAEKIRSAYEDTDFNDDLFYDVGIEKLLLEAQGIHLRPCVEKESDAFISQTPWHILNEEKISTPFMMGSASFAGLHEALSHDAESISQLNEDFANFMPDDLHFEKGREEMVNVANQIKTQYFGENEIEGNSDEFALSYTDAAFLCPMIRTARALLEAGAPVYMYEFAFVGAFNRERSALGSEVNGSARGDIVGYLFTQGDQLPEEGSREEEMVNLMTDLWISFVKNGTPSSGSVEWSPLESTAELVEEWLWIGSEVIPQRGLHLHRLQLWTDIYEAHFVERNSTGGLARSPALILAAVYLLGLFPRSINM